MSDLFCDVDRGLIKFAVDYILMGVAIENGVYHDQPSLDIDMQKLIDDGKLPAGWYKLKKILDT